MQINAINNSLPFQQRIKFDKPKLEILAQSAIGTTILSTGAATVADGGLSIYATNDNHKSIESIPQGLVKSHRGILFEDNDGKGFPVLTTVGPAAMSAAGMVTSVGASNAFKNAFGEDNLDATTAIPIDASKVVSANEYVQNSALGTGYLGTAAASLYSGINGVDGDDTARKLAAFSLLTGGLSAAVPIVGGLGYLASMASDTKSGKFIADTLSDGKKDKKIPS